MSLGLTAFDPPLSHSRRPACDTTMTSQPSLGIGIVRKLQELQPSTAEMPRRMDATAPAGYTGGTQTAQCGHPQLPIRYRGCQAQHRAACRVLCCMSERGAATAPICRTLGGSDRQSHLYIHWARGGSAPHRLHAIMQALQALPIVCFNFSCIILRHHLPVFMIIASSKSVRPWTSRL